MMKPLLLGLLCGWVSLASAQQPSPAPTKPELPPGPLLGRAPEFAQWTITNKMNEATSAAPAGGQPADTKPAASPASAAGAKKSNDPADAAITVVKTKDVRFEQMVWMDGSKLQKWCFPDMQLTLRGRGAPTVALPGVANGTATYSDYSKTDFANLEWISARNFTGISKVSGQDCLVFKDKIKLNADDASTDARPVTACIAVEGRLPVALQIGDTLRTYQFGAPPTEMLTPPADIAKVVDKWRKSLRQASLMPTKP